MARAGLQRPAVLHHRLDRIGAQRPGELLALGLQAAHHRHRHLASRRNRRRRRASSASRARRRPRRRGRYGLPATGTPRCAGTGRVRSSQRTTFAHWLISSGRSRHELIHLLKVTPMIVSEVGRTTSGSASSSPPARVTSATSGAKPSTCSASCIRKLFGDEQREIGVLVAGLFDALIEPALDRLPDRVAMGLDDHAAAHWRVLAQPGLIDDIQVPLRIVCCACCDAFFGHSPSTLSVPPSFIVAWWSTRTGGTFSGETRRARKNPSRAVCSRTGQLARGTTLLGARCTPPLCRYGSHTGSDSASRSRWTNRHTLGDAIRHPR